jgi:CO/xanthine dehydrogenase Mo-binding subunit
MVFANAAHCCLVEIDPRTGQITLRKYVVIHDCGRELNPLIVEGMVHGSTVHGIGAALLEEFRYDETGQLLTSTFMDYLKPTAADVPTIEVDRLEHPSPVTPLGAKGGGRAARSRAPPRSPTRSRTRSRTWGSWYVRSRSRRSRSGAG